MSFSLSKYTKIDVDRGFTPDLTGKLTALPRPPSWFQGGRFAVGGKWRGEGRTRGRGEGEGKGGIGKGGERGEWGREGKGEVGGNSALAVGGIDAPGQGLRSPRGYMRKIKITGGNYLLSRHNQLVNLLPTTY